MNKPVKCGPLIEDITEITSNKGEAHLLLEHHYIPRPPRHLLCEPTSLPDFVAGSAPKVQSTQRKY